MIQYWVPAAKVSNGIWIAVLIVAITGIQLLGVRVVSIARPENRILASSTESPASVTVWRVRVLVLHFQDHHAVRAHHTWNRFGSRRRSQQGSHGFQDLARFPVFHLPVSRRERSLFRLSLRDHVCVILIYRYRDGRNCHRRDAEPPQER